MASFAEAHFVARRYLYIKFPKSKKKKSISKRKMRGDAIVASSQGAS